MPVENKLKETTNKEEILVQKIIRTEYKVECNKHLKST